MKRRSLFSLLTLLALTLRAPSTPAEGKEGPPPAPPPGDVPERAAALLDAIVHDDPARAMDFFLPRDAFHVIKAMDDPDLSYKPLKRAYEKDIHELHAKLKDLDKAKFVRVAFTGKRTYVLRGQEANAKPYWAQRQSSLIYKVGDEERKIELRVMIAWENRWYVTHLSRFKQ